MKVNCVVLYLNGGKIKIIIRNHILGDVIANGHSLYGHTYLM